MKKATNLPSCVVRNAATFCRGAGWGMFNTRSVIAIAKTASEKKTIRSSAAAAPKVSGSTREDAIAVG